MANKANASCKTPHNWFSLLSCHITCFSTRLQAVAGLEGYRNSRLTLARMRVLAEE
jgi:hypothetical protein